MALKMVIYMVYLIYKLKYMPKISFHRVFNSMKNGFFRAQLTDITKNIWEMGSHIFFYFLYK